MAAITESRHIAGSACNAPLEAICISPYGSYPLSGPRPGPSFPQRAKRKARRSSRPKPRRQEAAQPADRPHRAPHPPLAAFFLPGRRAFSSPASGAAILTARTQLPPSAGSETGAARHAGNWSPALHAVVVELPGGTARWAAAVSPLRQQPRGPGVGLGWGACGKHVLSSFLFHVRHRSHPRTSALNLLLAFCSAKGKKIQHHQNQTRALG